MYCEYGGGGLGREGLVKPVKTSVVNKDHEECQSVCQ